MQAYVDGPIDMRAYMETWAKPLEGMQLSAIHQLAREFAENCIPAQLYPQAVETLNAHKNSGDLMVLISASPTLIVEPIAQLLGIEHVIAIDLHTETGKLTSQVKEPLSFREGKLVCLHRWLQQQQRESLPLSAMYSDSIHDLPLLEVAALSFVINPDPHLQQIALQQGWQICFW